MVMFMRPQCPLLSRQFPFFLGGMGAAALLWLVVLWQALAVSSWNGPVDEQPRAAVTADALPYANSEQHFSPRRTNSFFSSAPQDVQYFLLIWPFCVAILVLSICAVRAAQFNLKHSFCAHWLQLQTLNISRAPPSAPPFIFY